ncbi:MAG: ATP-binding protein [Candidatus Aminicenantes bacterium]|nr:ATP-binding protein [Candidatus Aminicenantes bacterium]
MFFKRSLLAKILPALDAPESIVITGMRRTGKTTLLRHLYGLVPPGNKLFLDLENPLNRKYFEDDNYERIKANLSFLGLDFSRRAHVFLDEIQHQRNLPSAAKYLIDHADVKFYMTGSAGFAVKNLFTETLAGRKRLFELYPLTFREFLVFKDSRLVLPEDPRAVGRPMYDAVLPLYEEYLAFGGFPGVVLKTTAEEKREALDEIFASYFNQDVVQLGDFRKNAVLRDFILLLAARIGSKLDIQKISRELGVARPTLYDYLAFLEGTSFLQLVRPLTSGRDGEIRKAPKVYVCDTGLAGRLARLDAGLLFENAVFQNLRPRGELRFFQKKNGPEIDFILDRRAGFEVKRSPQPSDLTRARSAASRMKLESCVLVSGAYSELDGITYGFLV